MSEQTTIVRLEVSAGGAVRVLSDVGTAGEQSAQKLQASFGKAAADFQKAQQSAARLSGTMDTLGSSLKRIAETALGVNLSQAFQGAIGYAKSLVTEGLQYGASLEDSRLAIAALLQGTSTLVDSTGKTVSATAAWQANLKAAGQLQQQIAQTSASTLGTQQELLDVFRGVLAFSRGQQASEQERLKLSQGILNVGKLQGLNSALLEAETRQILTLESQRGQVILPLLGLTLKQAQAYKQQGTLVQELNTRLEVYNQLAQDAELTWKGIVTTIETFWNLLSANTFASTFAGLKEVLIGARDEITKLQKASEQTVSLGISEADLRRLGTVLADVFADLVKKSAEATNAILGAIVRINAALEELRGGQLASVGGDIFSVLALSAKGLGNIIDGVVIPFIRTFVESMVFLEQVLVRVGTAIKELRFADLGTELEKARLAAKQAGDEFQLAYLKLVEDKGAKDSVNLLGVSFQRVTAQQQVHLAITGQLEGAYTRNSAAIQDNNTKVSTAAKFHAEAAKAALDFAKSLAEITGNVEGFRQAGLDSIAADTARKIQQAKKDSASILDIRKEEAIKQQQLDLEVNKLFLAQLSKRVDAVKQSADAETSYRSAQVNAQATLVKSQQDLTQARLEYVKVFASGSQQEITLTQQIVALQKQELQSQVDLNRIQLKNAQEGLVALAQQQDALLKKIVAENLSTKAGEAQAQQDKEASARITAEYLKQAGIIDELTAKQQALGQSIESAALRGQVAFQQLNAELTRSALVSTSTLGDAFDQIITGILQGTQKLDNILSSTGQAIGAKFFKQLIVGKNQNFDVPLIGNVSQLFLGGNGGIIGAIFGQGGQAAAGQFGGAVSAHLFGGGGGGGLLGGVFSKGGSAAASIFGGSFLQGWGVDLPVLSANLGIFGGDLAHVFTDGFSNVFKSGAGVLEGLGKFGAGLAGGLLGEGISSLFGINKSQEAQIGAKVLGTIGGIIGSIWGPVGSFIGSFLGDVVGALLGGLFEHIPTKGTQIRKAIRGWLQDLDVEFADEISSNRYGFDWIKAYAKQTGTDFLEASKHFIPENFGALVAQGLDKQLLAIGITVTKGQAEKLGKSLEQTGFTFANMIVDNLGGDATKISAFIKDLVSKADLNFDNVAQAITDAFNTHAIGLETFQAALAGTVSLFLNDYPKAVNVARLATESFTADGTFNLDTFKQKLEDNKAAVDQLKQAISQPIAQGGTGQLTQIEVSKQTKDNIISSIRDAVTQGFITGFINAAFESSGLAAPLAHIQELIRQYTSGAIDQAGFLSGIQTTLQAAGPAIERFAQAAGVASTELHNALAAAGLLPGALNNVSAAAQQAAQVIKDGLAKRLSPEAIAANFESVLKNAIITSVADAVVAGFVKAALATAALAEPLRRIQKLIDDYLAGTLSSEQFAAGLKAAFADAEPAIRRAAAAIGLASDQIRDFLDALDVGFTSATDSADGLVTKIKEIASLLRDLGNARIQVQIDLASQLGSIGALTPTQVLAARETPLSPTVDRFTNPRPGPIGTRPFAGTSDADLQQGFDALGQMADLAVERFQAYEAEQNAALKDRLDAITKETKATIDSINEQTKATIDGIHAEFEARREAGQAVIDGLQRQKDLQRDLFQDQLDALKAQLQAAQEFKRVSESIQQTINSLAIGKDSTLAGPEKLAFLQRQASELRGNRSAEAMEKLSKNLESQLQVGHDVLTPAQFAERFSGVITELQNLRDAAASQGRSAEDIQLQIEATQARMKATLDSIDEQIKSQQKYIQSLATNENNAVAAAQKAGAARIEAAQQAGDARIVAAQADTKAAIDAYRVVIIARLQELAAARDALLREQISRAQALHAEAQGRLEALVGTDEAKALLNDPQSAHIQKLAEINLSVLATKASIDAFLGAIHPAASGFYSPQLAGNQLFLAHKGEEVSIAQPGQLRSAPVSTTSHQSFSVKVDMGGITVAVANATPEQARSFASTLAQATVDEIDQLLVERYKRGPLGQAVQTSINRGPR